MWLAWSRSIWLRAWLTERLGVPAGFDPPHDADHPIGVAISNAAPSQLTEHLGEGRNDLFQKICVPRELFDTSGVGGDFPTRDAAHFISNGGDQLIAGILGCLVVVILFRTI